MIYLLHFERPIAKNHTCQHYVGYTDDLEQRIAAHQAGTGARLCEVATERGIGFEVARVWIGDRTLERRIKNRKESGQLCPICSPDAWHRRGHYASNWRPGTAPAPCPF